MSVVLTIDRLVLDDWTRGSADAALVRAAVEQELARLVSSAPPDFGSGGAVPSLSAANVDWPLKAEAAAAGQHIARAVHGVLGGGAAIPAAPPAGRPA